MYRSGALLVRWAPAARARTVPPTMPANTAATNALRQRLRAQARTRNATPSTPSVNAKALVPGNGANPLP